MRAIARKPIGPIGRALSPPEFPSKSGKKWPAVDLEKVAKSVGMPGRQNGGACHFFGGGGDHVKHGDLDSSLTKPSRDMDVHMAVDGATIQDHEGQAAL